ncbi:MAG: NADP-dependent phosphogluconate dehydrogenase [Niastella sp.]|nr:NADP-dependent phosphogluconate dehydrogenase [Niastella sp.]
MKNNSDFNYGMIGLGTMGANLVLNMNDKGYSVAGYDKDQKKVDQLNAEGRQEVKAFNDIAVFTQSLETPRAILLLVPAGHIVDSVINDLLPHLQKDDIIIDCGNSHFTDTQARIATLEPKGIHFMGLGVSGGETGARFGPSIMPGGDKQAYERIAQMLKDIAAKANGEPCTAYMGNGAAGHYVKMVHNGIEYALMQLISEAYHLLKKHGEFDNEELADLFTNWGKGILQSYLIEITGAIFKQPDDNSNEMLIDKIKDSAHQKGTGAWTSQDAMNVQAPIPAIDAAVSQRILSSMKSTRVQASEKYKNAHVIIKASNKQAFAHLMEEALYAAFIITYGQGLAMLSKASAYYKFETDIATVASIWRGGCIIRAELLNEITKAYRNNKNLENILEADEFISKVKTNQNALRSVVQTAADQHIPVPALYANLAYFDSYVSAWLPANLIQAQRDFFGAHTYERNDKEGIFHTEWNQKIQ